MNLFLRFIALFFIIFSAVARAEDARQVYEIRVYSTTSEAQQKRINDYWQSAAIPAYHRLGIHPIGVFTDAQDSPTSKIYVIIPCDSLEVFGGIKSKLAADDAYQHAAADFLNATKQDPAFARIETSLNVAFAGMKKLVPQPGAEKPNVFEMRTYQSPSEGKGDLKVQMFNNREIALMQELGMGPIFYSQTIAGAQMPNLTYMLSAANMDEHKAHWKAFGASPIWKQLNTEPQYKDIVSKVISVFLKRTPASEI